MPIFARRQKRKISARQTAVRISVMAIYVYARKPLTFSVLGVRVMFASADTLMLSIRGPPRELPPLWCWR